MSKRIIGSAIAAGIFLLAVLGGGDSQPESADLNTSVPSVNQMATTEKTIEPVKPTCDGSSITAHCVADGVSYATYLYHPAIPEQSHTETVTTYEEQVTGYCTLCVDGTFSPSCATGRGACSHHGGVAQWNAPRYSSVPKRTTRTIVDSPAKEAYYEKVTE